MIEEVVSFGDDSEFCIHSKLANELHGINSGEDSEYDQESSSNSDMDVDQDTQQIEGISKHEEKNRLTFIELFNQSSKYKNHFQMYNSRKLSWSESKTNYILKHYQLYKDFLKDNHGLSPKRSPRKMEKGYIEFIIETIEEDSILSVR